MKKIRVIAAIAAIVTAIAVYAYLESLKKPVVIPRTQVVVAAVEIKQGEKITAEMLSEKSVPSEAAVANAAPAIEGVVGKFSAAKVEPGEQILTTKCFDSGQAGTGLAYAVDKGMRAFTIPVDKVTSLSGLLRPGDRVDVLLIADINSVVTPAQLRRYLEADASGENSQPQSSAVPSSQQFKLVFSMLLLQDIKVLATDQAMKPEDGKKDPAAQTETVTLSVTPQQALQLNLSMAQGTIRLVLRPYGEPDTHNNGIVTNIIDAGNSDLLTLTGTSNPLATTSPKPSASPSPDATSSPEATASPAATGK